MKPLNAEEKGCNPISSNCVIWQGPTIECINLCKGDTVSEVVYKNATELCRILDILNISAYDLSCLNLTSCQPKDFEGLIQLLIERICNLEACTGCAPTCNGPAPEPTPAPADGCPDCEMPIASCFYFTNGLGDQVTYLQLKDYVTAIGNKICALISSIATTNENVQAIGDRLGTVETQVDTILSTPTPEPTVTVDCVLPAGTYPVSTVVDVLEQQFCLLRNATGTPEELLASIGNQCPNLSADTRLAGSGTMSSISGWVNSVSTVADSLTNMWLTICDLRAAVKNIQVNCCPSGCDAIVLNLTAQNTGTSVIIYVTGTIPANFVECYGNTVITLTDTAGGTTSVTASLVTIINSTFSIPTIPPSTINGALDINVEINTCLRDVNTGTTCQSCLRAVAPTTINCPPLSIFDVTTNDITYTFTSNAGAYIYTIQLYEGLTFISQNVSTVVG